ncbi:MAG: class I SAM-dependent methyltransferase [Pseudomonas sp.]|uniref:class I SAM-dependent methyltransferase n=1 Tax=Pseudomonas sp. TaxID=306 RepID=UPI0033977493
MSDVVALFGARTQAYASFRPHYPPALFHWLAAHSPAHRCALDIACGNGQASAPLLEHFDRVLACDASLEQLRAMPDAPRLSRFAANAETQPLPSACLDLIVVAQALHWFATPAFFSEAARLLKPGGLFCAWCYGLMRIEPLLDRVIEQFYRVTLAGHWPPGRASVDAGYRDVQPPFPRLQPPTFALQAQWSFGHLLGYLRTWSAVQRWEQMHGRDPLAELHEPLRQAWGDINRPRLVHWPLHFLMGFPAGQHLMHGG